MRAPIHEYYTDDEYQFALREMRKMIERQRIIAEAGIANSARANLRQTFNNQLKQAALATKNTLTNIKGEIDTAIKGQARTAIEETINSKLPEYDNMD